MDIQKSGGEGIDLLCPIMPTKVTKIYTKKDGHETISLNGTLNYEMDEDILDKTKSESR